MAQSLACWAAGEAPLSLPGRVEGIALSAAARSGISSGSSVSSGSSAAGNSTGELASDRLTLYVGTADGALFVYESARSSAETADEAAADTLRCGALSLRLRVGLKRFHPAQKPVGDLAVVERWGLLLSVSDGRLLAHRLAGEPLLAPAKTSPSDAIEAALGPELANSVAGYDVLSESDLLCVACKRSVVVLRARGADFSVAQRVTTQDSPREVRWAGPEVVCAGFVREYAFFDAQSGAEVKKPKMRTGIRKEPVLCRVAEQPPGELLLVKDSQGYFMDFSGQPARAGADGGQFITWSEQPLAVVACQPFIVALLPRRMEVHLASTCELLQTLPLQGMSMAASNTGSAMCAPALLAQDPANRQAVLLVANDKHVHMLSMQPLAEIVESALEDPEAAAFAAALALCEAAAQPLWGWRDTADPPRLYVGAGQSWGGLELLHASVHARAALLEFCVVDREPDLRGACRHLQRAASGGRLPLEFVTMLFCRSDLFDSPAAATTMSLNLADLRAELAAMLQALRPEEALPAPAACLALGHVSERLVSPLLVEAAEDLCELDGPELSDALLLVFLPLVLDVRRALLELLPKRTPAPRSRLGDVAGIVEETLGILDTLLLRAFVLRDALVAHSGAGGTGEGGGGMVTATEMRALVARTGEEKMHFLRGRNWCDVEEGEKLLLLYPEMWEELLWLYYGKGLHESALRWLRSLERNEGLRQGGGAPPPPPPPPPTTTTTTATTAAQNQQEEQDQSAEPAAPRSERPRAARSVPASSSPYLRKSIEYLKSLGAKHVETVLEHSAWVVERCVPRDSLRLFTDVPPGVEPIDDETIIKHLEGLDQEATEKALSAGMLPPPLLAIKYVEYLVRDKGLEEPDYHNKLALLFIEALVHLRGASGRGAAASERERQLREELMTFLENSQHYSAADLANRLKSTDLHEEYAVILGKLGRHKEALETYADKLGSFELAERYCERVYAPEDAARRDIFLLLLRTLVAAGQLDLALQIVHRHVDKVDAYKVLNELPGDLPLAKVQAFLDAALRQQSARAHDVQIVKQLVRKEHISVKQRLLRLERQHALITRRTVCASPTCGRPVLAGQAFARFPDGKIAHYACLDKFS